MNKLKTGYAYIYYFIYRYLASKNSRTKQSLRNPIPVHVRTHVLMGLAESLFLFSLFFEYRTFIDPNINFSIYIALMCIQLIFDVWFFILGKKEKGYIETFSTWPQKKQNKWNWIIRGILAIMIGNYIFVLYFVQVTTHTP